MHITLYPSYTAGMSIRDQLMKMWFPGKSLSQVGQVLSAPSTILSYGGTQLKSGPALNEVTAVMNEGLAAYKTEQAALAAAGQLKEPSIPDPYTGPITKSPAELPIAAKAHEEYQLTKLDAQISQAVAKASANLGGPAKARMRSAGKATEIHWKGRKWWQYGRRQGMLVTGPAGVTSKAPAQQLKLGGRYNAPQGKGQGAQVSSGV